MTTSPPNNTAAPEDSILPRAVAGERLNDVVLLHTKIQIPPLRAGLVPRPRLLDRLNRVSLPRLTMLAAPAGSGKTSLVTSWLSTVEAHIGWVSLDEADNDPARFWAYVLAALETAHPALATQSRALLHLSGMSAIEAALITMLNIAATLPERLLLALDDYHLINTDAIHRGLIFLIERLPPNFGIIIASRIDPPFALSRLRARGELLELRVADLRFTQQETHTLLVETLGLPLTETAAAALGERTEGWIVGLQLAALSMQGRRRSELDGFVRTFTGSHRYVLDYLMEEVFGQQPVAVQQFLLATAVLERLSAPLCAAMLADSSAEVVPGDRVSPDSEHEAQAMLEQLEQRALFLVPLDEERVWYRYHHLFADVLRLRLRGTAPALVPTLHRRASAWHERQGTPGEAIRHALAGGDGERAARLIEPLGWELLAQGRLVTLRGWIEALPADLVRARPTLGILHAWTLLHVGQHEVVERHLSAIEVVLADGAAHEPGTVALLHEVAAIRTVSSYARGTLSPRSARQSLQQLPDTRPYLYGMAALTLGILHTRTGDIATADHALSQVAALGRTSGDIGLLVQGLAGRARLCALRGQAHEAAELYRQILDLAVDGGGLSLPSAGQAHIGLAALLYEWHDLAAAEQHSRLGLALALEGAQASMLLFGHKVRARIVLARGEDAAAFAELREAERYCESAEDLAEVAALRARFWLKTGEIAAAIRWAAATGITPEAVEADEAERQTYHPYEFERLVLARVLAAEGHSAAALRILDSLLRRAEADQRSRSIVGILIVRAATAVAASRGDDGVVAIGRALALAVPSGQIYLFLNEGPPVAVALQRWLTIQSGQARDTAPDPLIAYARVILAAFPGPVASRAPEGVAANDTVLPEAGSVASPVPLAEPLSVRELDVLRLLAIGRSNRAIAAELFVTVGTVKKHLNNIFGKLAASNRTEVVARAREAGLLR